LWSFTSHHLGIYLKGLREKTINLEVGAQEGVISKYKSDKTSCSLAAHPGPMAYINKPTTLETITAKGQERNRGKYNKGRSMKSLGVCEVRSMGFLIFASL
jgi:hypothetical protein